MLLALSFTLLQESPPAEKKPEPPPRLSVEQIRAAGETIGLEFTRDQLAQMRKSVSEQIETYEHLWKLPLDNSVAPAFVFSALLPDRKSTRLNSSHVALPRMPASL